MSYGMAQDIYSFYVEPEDEGSSSCPHCSVSPEDVKDGHVELYNEWADANMPVAVNAVTGCLCRPEDFEGPRVPTQEELNELPF